MWKRRSRPAREPYSYLHHGTVVHGDLVVEGRLRVHGTVHGDVRVGGLLEVAEEGSVLGQRIEVGDVRILGCVRGHVHATGAVQIWRGGRLDGDVHAATLDIEEGARFSGRSHMAGADDPPAPSGGAASAAEPDAARPNVGEGASVVAAPDDGGEEAGGRAPGRTRGASALRRGGDTRATDERATQGEISSGGAAEGRSGPA